MSTWRDTLTAVSLALLLFVPVFIVCFLNCGQVVCDPDAGWHLRTADWIVAHAAVPQFDTFSRAGGKEPSAAGNKQGVAAAQGETIAGGQHVPWVDYGWGAQLVLGGLHRTLALRGLVVYTAILTLSVVLAFHVLVCRMQKNLLLSSALTLAVSLGMLPDATPRPWLFSMLFFVIELHVLLEAGRTGRPRLLLLLIPLFWVWANVHIQFVLGLLVLAAAVVEPLLARWAPLVLDGESTAIKAGRLLSVFVMCCGVTLLNPYHVRLYTTAAELLSQTRLWNVIIELQAMRFRSLCDWVVLGAALAGAAAIATRRPVRLLLALLFPLALYCSFRSRRDMWLVLIVGLALWASASRGISLAPRRLSTRVGWGVAVILAALTSGSLLILDEPWLESQVARKFPVQAVAFLKQGSYDGPMYNTYDWGGYLIAHYAEQPVCIDGRTLIHGAARIVHSVRMERGEEGWQSDAELAAARLLILPRKAALALLERSDPRFRVVYEDGTAVIFVRRQDANKH